MSFLLDRTWRFWDALWAFIICCSVTTAVLAVMLRAGAFGWTPVLAFPLLTVPGEVSVGFRSAALVSRRPPALVFPTLLAGLVGLLVIFLGLLGGLAEAVTGWEGEWALAAGGLVPGVF